MNGLPDVRELLAQLEIMALPVEFDYSPAPLGSYPRQVNGSSDCYRECNPASEVMGVMDDMGRLLASEVSHIGRIYSPSLQVWIDAGGNVERCVMVRACFRYFLHEGL